MNVQIASQQPPTSGKVILYTSHGQIDIQLWTKQTPLACKNFIQHCLEGYYTNTIFHRLIPGFMIQGGDPSGTGLGGQSIYDQKPFRDQFHQRLKFTRRGIVAMANVGKNTNGSQFFMTFGPCEHLNKKHTIFGKVVGDTIYNLMALQSLDTGQQDRPLDPPIIRKIKVVQNPFTDINIPIQLKETNTNKVQQNSANKQVTATQANLKQKKKDLKSLKNRNKLTFDEEQFNEQQTSKQSRPKIISSHDALYKKDAYLSNKVSITKQELQQRRKQKQLQQKKAQELKNKLGLKRQDEGQGQDQNRNVNEMLAKQMNKKRAQFQKVQKVDHYKGQDEILNYQKRYNPTTKKHEIIFKDQLDKQKAQKQRQQQLQRKAKQQQQITDQKLKQVRQLQMKQYNLLKADELNFKKAKQGSLKQRRKQIIHEEKKLLSNLEKHRYQFTKKQKQNQFEGELFGKLMGFANRLKTVRSGNNDNGQNEQQVQAKPAKFQFKNSWMNHQLKFHIDSSNAFSLGQKNAKNSVNPNQQDDGGLKMQIEYNNYQQQQQQQNEKF